MPAHAKHAAKQRKKEADTLAVQAFEQQTRAQAHAAADRTTEALAANALAMQRYGAVLNSQDAHLDALYNLGICELLQARLLRTTVAPAERRALRARARTRFERVLALDTSGRGEVSGLAHRTLAEMALQRARTRSDDSAQEEAAGDACTHFAEAERLLTPRGGVDAALLFHWAEALGVMMRCALREDDVAGAWGHASAAVSLYDRTLGYPQTTSSTDDTPVADTECLWAKASLLHEWCQVAASVAEEADASPTKSTMTVALSDAHDAAMAFLHVVYPESTLPATETTAGAEVVVDAVTAVMREITTTEARIPVSATDVASLADAHCLCGDLCDLSVQCTNDVVGPGDDKDGTDVRRAYLVRAARHYASASACATDHVDAWQGLGEACFELFKDADLENDTTDTLRALHHQADACFRQALRALESAEKQGAVVHDALTDARECMWYNLACLAALRTPFNATAESACQEWVQRCVACDAGVVSQMASDSDLESVHTSEWFRALNNAPHAATPNPTNVPTSSGEPNDEA